MTADQVGDSARIVEMNRAMQGTMRSVLVVIAATAVLFRDLGPTFVAAACAPLIFHIPSRRLRTAEAIDRWAAIFFATCHLTIVVTASASGGVSSPVVFFASVAGLISTAYFPSKTIWQVAPLATTVAVLIVALITSDIDQTGSFTFAVAAIINGSLPRHASDLVGLELAYRDRATVDSLTGCLNRRSLDRHLNELAAQAQRRHAPVGALVIDIDHFKGINDRHGHARGDQVLEDFADAVRAELRQFELFFRIGGEEFLILLPGIDASRLEQVAERVLRSIRTVHIGTESVTASIGIAWFEADEPFVDVIARADCELYRAKAAGRNRVAGP